MAEERRLAAILAADVVGYGRLIGADETGTLAALKAWRKDVLAPLVAKNHGRIFKVMGDGVLVEFGSPVDAVRCAVGLQQGMAAANAGALEGRRIVLRIGVNLGDVVVEGGDRYGDGVNIAARLEGMADPGGILVSGTTYDHVRNKVEAGFKDLGVQSLKNIAEPVRVYRVTGPPPVFLAEPKAGTDKPSIAVLPFVNITGDASQQYLSDGITEDIITELARFKNISVAARHASFQYGGKGVDPRQVARDLRAKYVLEGSVRKSGERLRITAQLIDAESGNHVWTERYDRDSHDVFTVQDEVVSAIVATLEGRMVATAAELARRKPTTSWSAYDCLLQGRELSNYYKEKDAIPFFTRATMIDPNFAQAHAWLALALAITFVLEARAQFLSEAVQAAQRAMALDSNDSTVHWANALALMYLREHERAGVHFDRAIALNPADVQIRADRATWLRFMGRLGEALAAIDNALKVGPLAPQWFWEWRGEIMFDLRRYREAIDALNNVPQKSHIAYSYMAAAWAHLDDEANASKALDKAKEIRPSVSKSELTIVTPHVAKNTLDHLLDGLRKAGLTD